LIAQVQGLLHVTIFFFKMANQRSGTTDWLPWFSFLGEGIIECMFCQKKYVYVKKRALKHYGYLVKIQRIVCTKMPAAVRRQFQNCGGNAPPRMTHMELYGTLAPSSGATQPSSTQSTHTMANVDLERNDGAPVEEPLESSQERSRGDSCNPRSLCQQAFTEVYHITKRKELDEKWTTFFYEANVAFNVAKHPAFIATVTATSRAGFDYSPPTYHAMRTRHIEPKLKKVKAEIKKATKQSITLYGHYML
jgi:hypothetical protein